MNNQIKGKKEYYYSVHSKYGAGYFSSWDALTQSEEYIGDMEVYKLSSKEAAHDDALAHLHHVQKNLCSEYELPENWFQHLKHLRQESLDTHPSPFDPA